MIGIRVVQWATGGVGRAAIEAIQKHPDLELVGCWVHSPEKHGKDADEILALEAGTRGPALRSGGAGRPGHLRRDPRLAPVLHRGCVNSIPYVVAAEPGIRTYLDLPLVAGRAHPDLARR